MGGEYKHKVNRRRKTVVRIVCGGTKYLLKREEIRYGVDLVEERGGDSVINIKIPEKHKGLVER